MGEDARVDYTTDGVATRYAAGRVLEGQQLFAWRRATAPYLGCPPAPGVVLDLGSGVGVFSVALRRWTGRSVVAVEPAAAMRAKATVEAGVLPLAGVAEHLPLRDCCVSAAWLSAVVHHFDDLHAAVVELGRVVAEGGLVLIRGLFRDAARIRWLEQFPGHERSYRRFPTVDSTRDDFATGGFDLVAVHDVVERHSTNAEAVAWAREMRATDSVLIGLSDDEFAAGLSALESSPHERVPSAINLVVLRKATDRRPRRPRRHHPRRAAAQH